MEIIITEQEIKKRVEGKLSKFPFTKEEVEHIKNIPYHDWNDIDLALKVNNMIQAQFFS